MLTDFPLGLLPSGWCTKGRLEVRERQLKLRCHVPVGALKFSHEDHVDTLIRATDSGLHE